MHTLNLIVLIVFSPIFASPAEKSFNLCSPNRKIVPAPMLVHIVEFSTAVVEVDTKVTNANLTQNQCLRCVTPPLTHVEITATARRH